MISEREISVLADKLKPYIVPWLPRVTGNGGGGSGSLLTHDLVGAYHKATGLTAGNVLKALSPTSFGFGVVQWSEINKSGSSLADLTTKTHSLLSGLTSDDHTQYVHNSTARSITAQHTFAPGSAQAPFALSANAQGQTVVGLKADQLNKSVTAGAGLSGAGALTADITVSMGTPSTLTVATANSASGTTHSHAITSNSAPGAAASILASNASGQLTLPLLVATTSLTTPSLTSSAALAITSAAGNISLDASTDVITVGASNTLKTANYASQTTGWGIDYTGGADFRYLFTDELHAKSFIADLEQALAGGQIISKSVAVLAVNFTVPAAGATATLRVKDLPSAANMAVFQSGDIVRLRSFSRASGALTIGNCWGVVTSYTDQSDGTQTWTFTRSTSTNAGSITAGTVINADSIVLDYGTTGNGFYEVNAIDGAYAANSPYWQIATWTSHPATGTTVNVRGGKLTGITSTANEFGLFAGSGVTSSDSFVKISNVEVVQNNVDSAWSSGGTNLVTIDATHGLSLQTFDATGSVISWGDQRVISWAETIGATPDGALWAQRETGFNGFYLRANQVGSQVGYFDITADGSGDTNLFLTGGVSGGAAASATLYTHDVLIDLGSGTSGTGTFTAYVSQLLLNDLTTGGGDGSASAPILSFVGDTNTGVYRSAADQLNISTGGTSRITINNTSLAVHQNTDNPSFVGYAQIGYIGHAGYAGFAHASSATSSAYAVIQHSTGETYLNAATTKRIHFRNNNTEVMNMSDVGLRIGDGTTPTEALEVTGTIYTSNRLVAGGADLSSNVSKFTGRYSTNSGISLTAAPWGLGSAVLFNAYHADTSVRLSASGACKYLGSQYTGNVTAPGMFYYDANANRFEWWVGEAGLANGANITAWAERLRLGSAGKLTLFGDLEWSSGGFAAGWTALTYNTGWASYGSPYKAMSYCRIGDLVMVNGLVLRSSGTSTTIGTLPSGYRPTTNKVFDARANINSTVVSIRVDVDTSGNVTAVNLAGGDTVGFISLDNVQFRTNS